MRKSEMVEKLTEVVEDVDRPCAGYVVYKHLGSDVKGARLYILYNKIHAPKGYGILMHDTIDSAEEQILDDLGATDDGKKVFICATPQYVIQAVYWDGGSIYIPNSVHPIGEKEVE